ncbi:MAG: integral rane sensor hybrid histidine kinase, partial [Verrucomicrobiales bacterium]|nr:integral rane sensor hybrid histidine kinase [Verrucomicrobiales bacterium]
MNGSRGCVGGGSGGWGAAPGGIRMIEFFQHLFDTSGFPPRWTCGRWTEGHGWLHIVSDVAIAAAYAAIPVSLLYLIRKRRDVPFGPVFGLFALFIICCGLTHLVEASLFWYPWYRLSGLLKAMTAVVSWLTVVALWRVLPEMLALPGLARVNRQLKEEIAERRQAEEARRESEERLQFVAERSQVGY